MPSKNHVAVASAVLFAGLILVAATGEAASCSKDCSDPCSGGCEISSPNCAVGCSSDGCSATCTEFKNSSTTGGSCINVISVTCSTGEGPGGPESEGLASTPGWALLAYSFEPVAVLTVAYSSIEMAAVGEVEVNQVMTQFSDGARVTDPTAQRWAFVVQPGGSCTAFRPHLAVTTLKGQRVRNENGIYVRGVTGPAGDVVAIEVLHSLRPSADRALVSFVKKNLTLESIPGGFEPLEFFGFFQFQDGEFGYMIGGAKRLQ